MADSSPVDDPWTQGMRAALDGDEAAYARLLTQVASVLRVSAARALERHGRSSADAEDLVQETLLALHLKRHTWNRSEPLGPWLRAILRYKLIDFLRRRGTKTFHPIDDLIETLPAPETAPALASYDWERLCGALPEKQRTIVTALVIEGRSAREAGQALAMSEGAVRVTLHRALARLKQLVQGER